MIGTRVHGRWNVICAATAVRRVNVTTSAAELTRVRTIRRVQRSDEDDGNLDAGDFSAWLGSALSAIRDGDRRRCPAAGAPRAARSSQFVHIEPDEADALAHIPAALLFPAPGRPHGHVLLGFDERGHCPMLVEGGCSIYEHRPRTCRTYDCRVFAATGLEPGAAAGGHRPPGPPLALPRS